MPTTLTSLVKNFKQRLSLLHVPGGHGHEQKRHGAWATGDLLSSKERRLVEKWSDTKKLSTDEAEIIQRVIRRQTPLSSAITVYRGVSDEDTRDIGNSWRVNSFLSTTRARHVAAQYGDGKIVSIRIPVGTRVLDTQAHGWQGSYEVLLGRGTKLVAESPSRWRVLVDKK